MVESVFYYLFAVFIQIVGIILTYNMGWEGGTLVNLGALVIQCIILYNMIENAKSKICTRIGIAITVPWILFGYGILIFGLPDFLIP